MKNKPLAGAGVVNLDDVRRGRRENDALIVRGSKREARKYEHIGLSPELANSISMEEAFAIAQSIVKKYSANKSLFSAYLARKKRQPSAASDEEFHVVLQRHKDSVAAYTTTDLRAFFALYSGKSSEFYEIYALSAAEEYLGRFPKKDQ